jgi:hypothetical protein
MYTKKDASRRCATTNPGNDDHQSPGETVTGRQMDRPIRRSSLTLEREEHIKTKNRWASDLICPVERLGSTYLKERP